MKRKIASNLHDLQKKTIRTLFNIKEQGMKSILNTATFGTIMENVSLKLKTIDHVDFHIKMPQDVNLMESATEKDVCSSIIIKICLF